MWCEALAGRTPRPDLANLDIYGEIGAELDQDAVEIGAVADFSALYLEQLQQRDAFCMLRADPRLWRGGAALRRARSPAMAATTPDQSLPNFSCRYSRSVGYHGLSVRPMSQRQQDEKRSSSQTGRPSISPDGSNTCVSSFETIGPSSFVSTA